MSDLLPWHDEAELLGVHVRAFFFDPAEVDAQPDAVARLLPILGGCGARLLGGDALRETYRAGGLLAQPDAVLAHGSGLLCLSHRQGEVRPFTRDGWRQQLSADVVLHSLAAAMAVAGQTQQPTAALWRGANLLCQFDPAPAVLECLATHIGAARHYWNAPQSVSPAQLARFCEPRLRSLPGLDSALPAAA